MCVHRKVLAGSVAYHVVYNFVHYMALLKMFSRHSNDMLSKVAKLPCAFHVTNIFCPIPYMLINGWNTFFHFTNTLVYTTYMCTIVTCMVVHTSHYTVHFVGNLATCSKETIERIFVYVDCTCSHSGCKGRTWSPDFNSNGEDEWGSGCGRGGGDICDSEECRKVWRSVGASTLVYWRILLEVTPPKLQFRVVNGSDESVIFCVGLV